MRKKRLDKVELEQLIDQYLMKNIPLSLLIHSYNLDYPQMKLLINRVKGFTRQTNALSERYENYNYEDVSEDHLTIPHIFTEEYPVEHEKQMELFQRLEELKPSVDQLEKIDLKGLESKILLLKNKLASYDQVAIGNIKDFVAEYDKLVSEGTKVDESIFVKLLLKHHIEPSESQRLNMMYEEYLNTQNELLQTERELEIQKASLKALEKAKREYEDVREQLVVHNVKLVNWCIRQFFNSIPIPKEEAQAFGLEGLVKAINSFDYKKGFHFSTYAVVVIVRHIQRHFEELYGLKWKDYTRKNAIKYYRQLMLDIDPTRTTEPTPQELADMGLISLSVSEIAASDKLLEPSIPFSEVYDDFDDGYPHTKAHEMPVTMDEYEEYDEYEDRTSILVEDDFYDAILDKAISQNLHLAVESLSPREAEVIRYRFGLYDGRTYTLEELAKIFGLTRERIRQIEIKAIRKLRHPSRARPLRSYVEEYDSPYRSGSSSSFEVPEYKTYEKIRYLITVGVEKDGILRFMNMDGHNWEMEDLEHEINLLEAMTDAIIDFASAGLTLSSIRRKISDDFFKSLPLQFIVETLKLNRERLDPEVLAELLPPEEPKETKKM